MGKKKDKKNKKSEVETTSTATGAVDSPFVYEPGQKYLILYRAIETAMLKVPGDTFHQTEFGLVRGRNTVNAETQKSRVSFQLNGERITAPNLKKAFKGEGATAPAETETPEERKEATEEETINEEVVLVTEKQLNKKYKRVKIIETFEASEFGKKKERAAFLKGLQAITKKKLTGQVVIDKMKSNFLKLEEKEFFNFFEALEG